MHNSEKAAIAYMYSEIHVAIWAGYRGICKRSICICWPFMKTRRSYLGTTFDKVGEKILRFPFKLRLL